MFCSCMHGFSSGARTFSHCQKNMHVRLTGDPKLSFGVSVSVHGCLSRLSLCGPVTGDTYRLYCASHLMVAGIGSSPPHDPTLD